jgi:DNA-binding NarL/FixJ family response regulator
LIRIIVADDHTLVRKGIRLLLETIPHVTVVGEAADGAEALRLIRETRPDVALVDLAMPVMGGLEVVRRTAQEFPPTRTIVLSMHDDEAYVHEALAAGASGYLLKGSEKAELDLALRAVARGQTYLTPGASRAVIASLGARRPGGRTSRGDVLTARQREVLRLVAEGHTTREVASRLGLSVKTVETHRGALMRRLGIRDLAGLVRYAVRIGLVQTK